MESSTVDWTSLVFMVVYIPFIIPGAWIMDRLVRMERMMFITMLVSVLLHRYHKGLRVTVLLGAIGTASAAWINAVGVAPDLFYVIHR